MKKLSFIVFTFFYYAVFSQSERYPIFKECEKVSIAESKECFYNQTKKHFFKEFKTPEDIVTQKYRGLVNIVFIVDDKGTFKSVFSNSPYLSLKQEVERVFKILPKIQPATYNNRAVEMQFVLPVLFPLGSNPSEIVAEDSAEDLRLVAQKQQIADSTFLNFKSGINIPFTHQRYVDYEYALNKQKGVHTAVKPYSYSEVSKFYDFEAEKKPFLKPDASSWIARKFWNEHLLQIKKPDYWLTLDFLVDVQLGKDNSDEQSYTFNNTRLAKIDGGFGKNFSYSAVVYESQGRFAQYINTYVSNPDKQTFKPVSSEGLVPGRGKAKGFGTGYDYPVAEGYLNYKASKYFNFQFGHGKNFIGDGYRSFLLSDVSSPATYLKAETTFWRLKYTNIWLWGLDVREFLANTNNREHIRKYVALHYLSVVISDRITLGLFEGAVSTGNGLDASFLNPLMLYRSVEFNRGEDVGNAVIGLTGKYKFKDNLIGYSQLLIDEFSFGNLGNLSDWRNKFALQVGAKYFDAFKVKNLFLQGEFNYARPYTFSHANPVLNYGHYSESLGHLWGANFWEMLAIARYKKARWTGAAKVLFGKKGFDKGDGVNYGGNIYTSYNDRYSDTENSIAQGNTANIFMIETQANYLLNPSNNLSLFAGLSYRNFNPIEKTANFTSNNNVWLSVGLRADLFNWYFDF